MIPEYCVPDSSLALTGANAVALLLAASVLLAVGIGAIFIRRRRTVVALFLVLALAPLSLLASPSAHAADLDTTCPKGYHYDASKDSRLKDPGANTAPTMPVPAPTQPGSPNPETPAACPAREGQSDDSWMVPNTKYIMKADGSSGLTAAGADIVNWDIAKATIRQYMGAGRDGIANKESSPYISEVTSLTESVTPEIAAACSKAVAEGKRPAAVFDADDTTLWTYDMEDAAMNFAFTPAKQQEWFDHNQMPATPGMVKLVKELHAAGCEIIGLTGRNNGQKDYTVKNLTDAGYVDTDNNPLFNTDLYFTKFRSSDPMPKYLNAFCDTEKHKCTTVQYKAGTREHIQTDLGYTIVANFGDQWSDLMGGRQDRWVKLPNPTYYLPSPNLPDWEEADRAAGMDPAESTFELAPDGSTGSQPGITADKIPNMDQVKATIRAYYQAQKGDGQMVANKEKSPYISEMDQLTDDLAAQVTQSCQAAKALSCKPAIVLDADDTTLWTYDMEEWMEFAFNKAKQDHYLRDDYHRLPATPGMVKVVTAAQDAGCTVIGLTGRADDLKEVTMRNLTEVGYPRIDTRLYFTKTSSDPTKLPDWVSCAGKKCTSAEFKTSVRRHIENDLGYRIVGNFGDQFSDLVGGYADHAYKLPNPTYYLP